jgi:putative spermidine/putrescine transport system permease protein
MGEDRSAAFHSLAAFFTAYVLFLYGPMIVIFILSFQGPNGGLIFPLNGLSLHWFERLWKGGVRSLELGLVVMVLTVLLSLSAGLAFRKRFAGSNVLFFVAVASLIVPSIATSLGIALEFRLLDDFLKNRGPAWVADNLKTTMGLFTSGLGAHLTWTLPFGLLVMFRGGPGFWDLRLSWRAAAPFDRRSER